MKNKIRKFMAMLLSIILIGGSLSAIPTVASAAETESEVVGAVSGDFEYSLYGGFDDFSTYYEYACITGYSGTATNLEIPSTIDGYTVEAIGYNAFEDCTSLVSVTIPDSVREIYTAVFCDCENLESITVDKANPEFSNMDGVLFNKDQTNLIFYPMSKKQQEYTVPITVKKISYKAFYEAKNLESAEISDNVASIGESAFAWAEKLKNIVFPENIDFIGNGAFAGTDWYNNQEDGVIYISRCLYEYKGWMPENTSIEIKDGTKTICDNSFDYCYGLINIKIPDSVTYIGERAFVGCNSLADVKLPENITFLGNNAFSGCENLKSVNIPEQLTETGWGVFDDCTNLETVYFNAIASKDDEGIYFGFSFEDSVKTVIFGDKVTDISSYFCDNTNLENVVLGRNVKIIGSSAFSGCTNLKSIKIPETVTKIDEYAFYGCKGLTSIVIPNSVKEIGASTFCDCTNLANIQIPSDIEKVGSEAFSNTEWYNNQPDGLLYIGKILYDFKGDKTKITDVEIKEGTTAILDNVFSECSNLKNVVIPDSVTSIGSYVFKNCTSLTDITIPESVSSLGFGLFSGCISLKKAKLPLNAEGSLVFTFESCENLESVNIPEGITGIYCTFAGCKKLEEIILPESLTYVPRVTFGGCASLKSINLPKNVENVSSDAFYGCISLEKITVDADNKNLCSVNDVLFSKDKTRMICYPAGKSEKNFDLPIETKRMDNYAFNSNEYIETVNLSDSIEKISGTAFNGCKSLKNIDLPSSVTEIMYCSFAGCSSLADVSIPTSVKKIGYSAFSGCQSLKAITIPENVERIEPAAVGYLSDYYDDAPETVDNFTIYGKSGSAAETYAKNNNFTFVDLDNKSYSHADKTSGINVVAKADAELSVTKISDKQSIDNVKLLIENDESILGMYDISLLKDGNKVQHEGMAEVQIPGSDKNAKVYRLESDNTLTDMNAVYKDGNLHFYTEHFSKYVVTSQKDCICGDVNSDGEVNAKDRMMLTRYLAKWSGYENIDMTAADVNNDDAVNAKDRMILTRHLAKWQGYETLPLK